MRKTNSRFCKNCDKVTERYKNGKCRPCSLEYAREYARTHTEERREYREANREATREQHAASSRSWYWRNRERVAERAKRYYADNRNKLLMANKEWREANSDRRKTSVNEYYQENAKAIRERSKRWKRENSNKVRVMNHRYRARVVNAKGDFTAKEWVQLKTDYGNACLCCGRADVELTIDHVIPLSMGGDNSINNIQPLCRGCNSAKKDKHIDYR